MAAPAAPPARRRHPRQDGARHLLSRPPRVRLAAQPPEVRASGLARPIQRGQRLRRVRAADGPRLVGPTIAGRHRVRPRGLRGRHLRGHRRGSRRRRFRPRRPVALWRTDPRGTRRPRQRGALRCDADRRIQHGGGADGRFGAAARRGALRLSVDGMDRATFRRPAGGCAALGDHRLDAAGRPALAAPGAGDSARRTATAGCWCSRRANSVAAGSTLSRPVPAIRSACGTPPPRTAGSTWSNRRAARRSRSTRGD